MQPRSRKWFGTIWNDDDLRIVQCENAKYIIISADDFTEENQKHWHCLIQYKEKKSHPKTLNAHWEIPNSLSGAVGYVKAKGQPIVELGQFDVDYRTDWNSFVEACKKMTTKELIESEYSHTFACHMSFANTVHNTYRKIDTLQSLNHEWVYGPPGTGKSYYAYSHEGAYIKSLNKWWDGYAGEEVVIIDDFGPNQECLIELLKHWTDVYPFRGEIKGGSIVIRPKKVIITSNYHPSELFKAVDRDAILRRCKLVEMTDPWSNTGIQGSGNVNL